jgi:hypothetical protein
MQKMGTGWGLSRLGDLQSFLQMEGRMKKRTKIFDLICFVLGPFIVAVYMNVQPVIVGTGVALICLGFLRKHWAKEKGMDEKP